MTTPRPHAGKDRRATETTTVIDKPVSEPQKQEREGREPALRQKTGDPGHLPTRWPCSEEKGTVGSFSSTLSGPECSRAQGKPRHPGKAVWKVHRFIILAPVVSFPSLSPSLQPLPPHHIPSLLPVSSEPILASFSLCPPTPTQALYGEAAFPWGPYCG